MAQSQDFIIRVCVVSTFTLNQTMRKCFIIIHTRDYAKLPSFQSTGFQTLNRFCAWI